MAQLDYSFLEQDDEESTGLLDYSFLAETPEEPEEAPITEPYTAPGEPQAPESYITPPVDPDQSNIEKVGERTSATLVSGATGLAEIAANQDPKLSDIVDKTEFSPSDTPMTMRAKVANTVGNYLGSMTGKGLVEIADLATEGDIREDIRDVNKDVSAEARRILGSQEGQYQGGAVEKFGYEVLEGAATMAPYLIASWGSKNPGIMLGGIGAQVAGNTYNNYMEKTGGDHARSMAAVKFNVLAEVIPETIPVMAFLRKAKIGGGTRRFLEGTLGEGGQEMLTEILQSTYDDVQLNEMTLKEAIQNIDWAQVRHAGLLGVGVGAILSTPGTVSDVMAKPDQDGNPPGLFNPTHKAGGGQDVQVVTKGGKVVPDTFINAQGEVFRDSNAIPNGPDANNVEFDVSATIGRVKEEIGFEQGVPTAEIGTVLPEAETVEMPTGIVARQLPGKPKGKPQAAPVQAPLPAKPKPEMKLAEITQAEIDSTIAGKLELDEVQPQKLVETKPEVADIAIGKPADVKKPPPPPPAAAGVKVLKPKPKPELVEAVAKPKRLEPRSKVVEEAQPEATVPRGSIKPTGKTSKIIIASTQQELEGRAAVVEGDSLVVSNDSAGNKNPNYPAELQPRDRKKGSSMLQIQKIAGNLKPELLEDNGQSNGGSPIIGPDGVVESGNGRTMAILAAYKTNQGEGYRKHLKDNAAAYGLTEAQIDAMKNPVLVRVRQGDMTMDERAEFARQSNQSGVAPMTPTENARADAERMSDADMTLYAPSEQGNILAAGNQSFLEKFGSRLGDLEIGGLSTPDGRWTKQMADRVQSAVFYKAYGDENLLALAAEEADPDIKNILNALNRAAPAFARARSVQKDLGSLDIISDLVSSIDLIRQAKADGTTVKQIVDQKGLFGDVDPVVAKLSEFIESSNRSPKRMGIGFSEMAKFLENELNNLSQESLFDLAPATKADIVAAANKRIIEEYGDEKAIQDLFAPQSEGRPTVNVSPVEPGSSSGEQVESAGTETQAAPEGLVASRGGAPQGGHAKAGGERGVNGEWYEGGQFMPASARTVKGAWRPEISKTGGAGRALVEPGLFGTPPPGGRAILGANHAFLYVENGVAKTIDNDAAMENYAGKEFYEKMVDLYNQGHRFVDQAGNPITEPGNNQLLARREEAPAAPYQAMEGKDISYQVRVESTGKTYTVTVDAAKTMKEMDTRIEALEELRKCI